MFCVVLITCPDERTAGRIARELLEARLAACVNVLGPLKSLYWWEGAIEEAREYLLIVKTRASLLDRLIEAVRRSHPYEVPEVIALPIVAGSEDYLAWLNEETRAGEGSEG